MVHQIIGSLNNEKFDETIYRDVHLPSFQAVHGKGLERTLIPLVIIKVMLAQNCVKLAAPTPTPRVYMYLVVGAAFIRNPVVIKGTSRILCRSMSMKALVVEEFGDSSKLKYSEVPKPVPADGEVIMHERHFRSLFMDKLED